MKLKFLFMLMLLLPMSSMAQKVAYAVFKDSTLTFYYDDKKPEGAYDVEKMVKDKYNLDTKEWNQVSEQIKTIVFDQSFKEYRPKSCKCWFDFCSNLVSIIGIKENLNTSEVTDMSAMFGHCHNLTSIDLSGFHTENVTDMCSMFWECHNLTSLDLSGFHTENVTNMSGMFWECANLTRLDLSGFNTSNVTNMSSMFHGCTNLTNLDISGFNTSNVTNMSGMFHFCIKLTDLDLSGFNTKNVTSMGGMFDRCVNIKTIYVGDGWNTSNDVLSDCMFADCHNLVGGKGTIYGKSRTKAKYAHIDDGKKNPGYFTKK